MDWIEEFKSSPIVHIVVLIVLSALVAVAHITRDENPKPEPRESTRTVMFTCTVKSNIEGVITLNDDCKITVIGEE